MEREKREMKEKETEKTNKQKSENQQPRKIWKWVCMDCTHVDIKRIDQEFDNFNIVWWTSNAQRITSMFLYSLSSTCQWTVCFQHCFHFRYFLRIFNQRKQQRKTFQFVVARCARCWCGHPVRSRCVRYERLPVLEIYNSIIKYSIFVLICN